MTHRAEDSGRADSDGFVHTLYSGVEPVDKAISLDTGVLRDLARKVREIDEARAAAAVSGRDYLIR